MLALLGRSAELVEIDYKNGELDGEHFHAINPLGEVPVLEDGALRLHDSQAIIAYLALAYGAPHWLPREAEAHGRVLQWLSFAANEIQNGPRIARAIVLYGIAGDLEATRTKARRVLQIMDVQLSRRPWLETSLPTIADVACYPYVSRADEAGISFSAYPNLTAWLRRVESLPGFIWLDPREF